jgi:mannosyltransferase
MTTKRIGPLAFLIAISIVHLALLSFRLSQDALWLDEMLSLRISGGSLAEAIRIFRVMPEQHPFYYVLLRLWLLGGQSDAWVRFLSVVIALGGLWACYYLARELFGDKVGRLAAALLAFSPFYLYLGREARMYGLVALLAMLSSLFLFRFLERRTVAYAAAYVVAATLGLYTHFFFVFLVAAHFVFSVARPASHWPRRKTTIPLFVLVGASYVPWLLLILISSSNEQSWKGTEHIVFGIPYTFFRFSLGYSILVANHAWKSQWLNLAYDWAAVIVPAALILGVVAAKGLGNAWRQGAAGRLTLLCLFGPMVGALAVSAVGPVLVGERYFMVSFPFFVIVLALGLNAPGLGFSRPWLRTALRAGYAILILVALLSFYLNPRFGREQWKSVAAHLEGSSRSDDLIVVDGPVLDLFRRYYGTSSGQRIVPASEVAAGLPPGNRVWLVMAHSPHDPMDWIASESSAHSVVSCWLYPRESGIRLYLFEPKDNGSALGDEEAADCAEVWVRRNYSVAQSVRLRLAERT